VPRKLLVTRLITTMRRPGVWLFIALFLLVTFLQETEILKHQAFLANLGINRYTIERILYLLPIFWAALLFGWRGGAITSLAALAFMLPSAILSSPNLEDALVEITGVFIIANLMSYSLESLRKERERRSKLEQAQQELQFFLEQVTKAQEEERKRIAWELHDDTIQSLVALCQQIDEVSGIKGLPRQARSRLQELRERSDTIMREVRRLSQDLRPATLDNLGLVAALEWLASDVARYSGLHTDVKVAGAERRFSTEVELVLFRIAQEALRNVWKHAQANSAQVVLEFLEGKTRLTISDDGKGFIPPLEINALPKSGKLGLAGMLERAHLLGGALALKSAPGKGTCVIAELPL
jgi:two-component system sensor histidine kinase DegS